MSLRFTRIWPVHPGPLSPKTLAETRLCVPFRCTSQFNYLPFSFVAVRPSDDQQGRWQRSVRLFLTGNLGSRSPSKYTLRVQSETLCSPVWDCRVSFLRIRTQLHRPKIGRQMSRWTWSHRRQSSIVKRYSWMPMISKRVSMGWWHLRLSAKILALLRLSANFFQLRLTKKLKK